MNKEKRSWSTKITNVRNMNYLFAHTKQMSCDIETVSSRRITNGLRILGIRL